jgi:hypothetical protein
MHAAIYVRVSPTNTGQGDSVTFDQNPEVQERPLPELISQFPARDCK